MPDDNVDFTVEETVELICAGAPLANRWHKKFVYRVADGMPGNRPLTEEEEAEGDACFDTEDYREGVNAFLKKKIPNFNGK